MLALLYAYLCVPRRLRFIARWFATCFVLAVLVMVLILSLPGAEIRFISASGKPL